MCFMPQYAKMIVQQVACTRHNTACHLYLFAGEVRVASHRSSLHSKTRRRFENDRNSSNTTIKRGASPLIRFIYILDYRGTCGSQ